MRKIASPLVVFLMLAAPTVSSGKSEKFVIFVTGGDDSRAVVQSLVQKFRNSKPFELVSIAADIVERFNNTAKDNVRQSLESCLFLTDSKCNVPEQLQEELGATQLSLGQYLMKHNK